MLCDGALEWFESRNHLPNVDDQFNPNTPVRTDKKLVWNTDNQIETKKKQSRKDSDLINWKNSLQ